MISLRRLHEPEASHLDLLTAFLPAAIVQQTYTDAVDRRYLWHEFGDLNLIRINSVHAIHLV
ncbi:hypothetical protein C7B65_22435 [Phormidesmis priestleyi ULC007]|uniref:Uncharacterized protein n=1 Tax=Phormidesmis priestleyi ULC007 TaxID=1920490 RepID=A0A2T1D6U0_9CYAN|nr:hypothetical protein C7B65_22435 [Phormidesmis priestleyi ULC007]PZO46928.1 MAG: hypothetical protein DCF14_21320 [Phormidesmis priestleyi]